MHACSPPTMLHYCRRFLHRSLQVMRLFSFSILTIIGSVNWIFTSMGKMPFSAAMPLNASADRRQGC